MEVIEHTWPLSLEIFPRKTVSERYLDNAANEQVTDSNGDA